MREIKNVLAATDFSDCAQTALNAASDTAELFGSRLVVAHVLQNLDHTYSLLVDDIEEEELKKAEANMGDAVDNLRISRSRTDSVVTRGAPVQALIQIALREHTDLLVAGMAGSACGSGTALGSVVDRLLRCGLFDLFLVRPDETPGIQSLAAATDFSEGADAAIDRAVDVAARAKLDKITIIHAFELPRGYSKLGLGEDETERRVRENIQTLFDELCERLPAPEGVTYEPVFVRGSDHDAIRKACIDKGVDLLVIGAAGRTDAAATLIGNVAMKIVRDAPCSVWVSRPAGHKITFVDAIQRLMGMKG